MMASLGFVLVLMIAGQPDPVVGHKLFTGPTAYGDCMTYGDTWLKGYVHNHPGAKVPSPPFECHRIVK